MESRTVANVADVKSDRRAYRKAVVTQERAAAEAERLHQRYLSTWDFLTDDYHLEGMRILHSKYTSPNSYREALSKKQ
jgi:hypothetical protein